MIDFTKENLLNKYNKYFFFYNGYLSNWAMVSFEDIRHNIKYNCSEQHMMHRKALLFNDEETAQKIMLAKTPREQKALGRTVKNFNKDIWDLHAREIVFEGCFYKFSQNQDAFQYLMDTEGTYLVEASPTDLVWGVGLSENDPKIKDPKNWKGTNWLGQVLTELRDYIVHPLQTI